jgi:hypothetical protein
MPRRGSPDFSSFFHSLSPINIQMKRLIPVLLLSLWFCALPGRLEAGDEERISVSVQVVTQAKTYSSAVGKAFALVTFPIAHSDTETWIMSVQKNTDEKTFFVSIDDPAVLRPAGNGAASAPVTIFSATLDVVNGKAITVLKTDQYTVDVTLVVH